MGRSGEELFASNSQQGDITKKSCIKCHWCKRMNMDETDEMSGSKCYALNAIRSVGGWDQFDRMLPFLILTSTGRRFIMEWSCCSKTCE